MTPESFLVIKWLAHYDCSFRVCWINERSSIFRWWLLVHIRASGTTIDKTGQKSLPSKAPSTQVCSSTVEALERVTGEARNHRSFFHASIGWSRLIWLWWSMENLCSLTWFYQAFEVIATSQKWKQISYKNKNTWMIINIAWSDKQNFKEQ